MKTNIFKSSFLALAMMASFSACTQNEEFGTPAPADEDILNVVAYSNNFVSTDAASRITDNGTTTTFTDGDAIGVFIVRDGEALVSNMKMTLSGTAWKGDNDAPLYYYKNADYIAYYPYTANLAVTTVDEIVEYFTSKISATGQTSLADYRNADLMTAEVKAAEVVRGQNITFSFAHKMAMLEVKDLEVYYGVIQAIKGISFEVNKGEVIALIGANGAGKTTTLHTVTGLLTPKKGQVIFEGKDITKVPAHKIVSMGMAHVPEGRRVFAELSVYENLKMGAYTRKNKNEIEESLANVYKRFPRLEERKNQMAGTLSGGEQQMLAMGRALMSKPKIILMDEPSMGLSPILVNEIFDIIRSVSESGTTVLLVEQNAKKALSIADRAYVLETGKIVLEGNAKDLLEDDSIKKAYLGE